MWMRRHDVEISQRLGEMKLSLYDREYNLLIKGVAHFKYLVRIMEETGINWPAVHQKISKAWAVWGGL